MSDHGAIRAMAKQHPEWTADTIALQLDMYVADVRDILRGRKPMQRKQKQQGRRT